MIRAVIFDFGSVIYKTRWKELDEFFRDKNGFGILLTDNNDAELIQIYQDSDSGKTDFKKFFIKLNPNIEIDLILEDYMEAYAKFKILNKDMLNIIKDLRNINLKLFGFTDIKKEHYEANYRSGLYDDFIEIFTSYSFGHIKAEKKAFEMLINKLQHYKLNPEECIFIDDNIHNIENARAFKFKTIHYTDFPSTKLFKAELYSIIKE